MLKEKWRSGNPNIRKPSSLVPICHTNNISWEVHILNLLGLEVQQSAFFFLTFIIFNLTFILLCSEVRSGFNFDMSDQSHSPTRSSESNKQDLSEQMFLLPFRAELDRIFPLKTVFHCKGIHTSTAEGSVGTMLFLNPTNFNKTFC